MEVFALTKYVGSSPRKMRMIAENVKKMKVSQAMELLKYHRSPAARVLSKTIKSAAANAENNYQMIPADLRITSILVNEGSRLKRFRPQARGRVSPILRRSCHIKVIVKEEE